MATTAAKSGKRARTEKKKTGAKKLTKQVSGPARRTDKTRNKSSAKSAVKPAAKSSAKPAPAAPPAPAPKPPAVTSPKPFMKPPLPATKFAAQKPAAAQLPSTPLLAASAPGSSAAPASTFDSRRPPVAARARPVSVVPPQDDVAAAPGALDEPVKTSVNIETARAIVEGADAAAIAEHAADLVSGKPTALATGARVLEEVLARKPEMLVPQIERLVSVVNSPNKRAVQTAALALPVMARLAPARVARHLPVLTERFATTTDIAKDGLVATFAALCTASVAYQKRLEPVLELALSGADAAILQKWTETILPSLKGEPHARARAVVEARLPHIPRAQAQPIATFLGIKLRPATAGGR